MTGYILEVGYNSSHHNSDVWSELVRVIGMIRAYPVSIYNEVLRVEKQPDEGSLDDLRRLSEYYKDCDDLTIRIDDTCPENTEPDDFFPTVRQLASSGNGFRGIKEQCRRAVCRLAIEAMHSKGMEINMIVA